jgi:CRISPR type I-A-associated protein Csa5
MELRTPGTGFIDLDIKIAYGLCRLGFEAGAEDMSITPTQGGFKIILDTNPERIKSAYQLLLQRLFSGKHLYKLPGIQARWIDKFPVYDSRKACIPGKFSDIYSHKLKSGFDFTRNKMCGHSEYPSFGGTSGLILAASSHAGMPYKTNNPFQSGRFNTKLCEVCGYLSLLGILSGVYRSIMKAKSKNYEVVTTPIPIKKLKKLDIELLFSSKLVVENKTITHVPLSTLPLCLLAKFPSITDVLSLSPFSLHIVVFEPGQTYRVNGVKISHLDRISEFLSHNTYNVAAVSDCLNKEPYIDVMQALNRVLIGKEPQTTRHQLMIFCRTWTARVNRSLESDKNRAAQPVKILLYKQTVKYLLQEEAMLSPEIIENEAVRSFARTMRFFNSDPQHLNYTFVDNIRNASQHSGEFEKTIEKMLRTAQSLRLSIDKESLEDGKSKQKMFINIPSEDEFKELIRLASEEFQQVKTALVCLSLCRPEYRAKRSSQSSETE